MKFDPITGEIIEETPTNDTFNSENIENNSSEQDIEGTTILTNDNTFENESSFSGGFDPMTGEPIVASQSESGKFDPMTVEPIVDNKDQIGGFDPMTGKPISGGNVKKSSAEMNKKPINKKLFIYGGIAIAAVLVCLIITTVVKNMGPRTMVSDNEWVGITNRYLYNLKGDSINLDELIADGYVYSRSFSIEGNAAAFCWDDTEDDIKRLFVMDTVSSKPNLIEIDLDDCPLKTYILGYSGKYLVYSVYDDDEYPLYIYSLSNKKTTKISDNVYNFVISEDGSQVLYVEYEDGDYTLFSSGIAKTATKIAKTWAQPISISNNGKTIYYKADENRLIYYDGKEKNKVTTKSSTYYSVSRNGKEIIYFADGNSYFYEPSLKNPTKISNKNVSPLLTNEQDYSYQLIAGQCYTSYIKPVDSFKNRVLHAYDTAYWLNKDGTNAIKIKSNIDKMALSDNGKVLTYICNDKLYQVKRFGNNIEPTLLFDEEDVSAFVTSPNGSKVYFSVDDDELWYLKGKNKGELISDELENYWEFTYNKFTSSVIYLEDEELFTAKTSSKSSKSIIDDVDDFDLIFGYIFIETNDDEVFLYSNKLVELDTFDD